MSRWGRLATAVLVLLLAGCTGTLRRIGPGGAEDGGAGVDSGLGQRDAGAGMDSAVPRDSGTPPRDSGTPPRDSGPPPVDAGSGCPSGQTMCGASCTDTSTDPMNCGMCGRACASGATCSGGTCMGGTGCPPPPSGVSANAAAAYNLENQVRTAMGVPCARMDTAANLGAERHCQYYSANSGTCVANPHVEVMGCSMFVAAQFWDRMTAAGYSGSPAFEDMHFIGDGAGAVQGWIDSVWHRTPVLSPWVRDIGYGNTSNCDTMDFGVGASSPSTIVATYPYANQTNVPTSFDGRREGPMPPAPSDGWPSGYPIHIYTNAAVSAHTLTVDGSSTPIAHVWLASGSAAAMGLLPHEDVMYANDPLSSGTTYHVHVVGSTTLDWTFTTR